MIQPLYTQISRESSNAQLIRASILLIGIDECAAALFRKRVVNKGIRRALAVGGGHTINWDCSTHPTHINEQRTPNTHSIKGDSQC